MAPWCIHRTGSVAEQALRSRTAPYTRTTTSCILSAAINSCHRATQISTQLAHPIGVFVLLLGLLTPRLVLGHSMTGTAVATVTRLDIGVDAVIGSYEVQFGELAALATRRQIDADGDGYLSREEQEVYTDRLALAWSSAIDLRLGDRIAVHLQAGEVIPRGGATSLAIPMALIYSFRAPLEFVGHRRALMLREANDLSGIAHRTVVISTDDLLNLDDVDVGGDVKGLQVESGSAPIQVDAHIIPATSRWGASSEPVEDGGMTDARRLAQAGSESSLGRMVAVLLALLLGALHALAPGHGKTMAAAYLVGERARTRHALQLGLVVAVTHVASVALLGLGLLLAHEWLPVQGMASWMILGAGVIIFGVGSWTVVRHLTPVVHEHSHEHSHLNMPSTVTTRGLLMLGLSGGVVPCGSAFALLLMATAEVGVEQGLMLVVAFSLGLATVLGGIGVLVVNARERIENWRLTRIDGWATRVPIVSALLVCLMGVWTMVRGLMDAGILVIRW